MKNNFISILITNYNKEKFLNETLKSVLNQRYSNYEIILFDDSSTDSSIKIIQKYKKIKLIRNKSKKKNSSKLNQINGIINCFEKSKGNIICLLDGDDFFKKNKLLEINKFFQNNKKSSCVFDFPTTTKSSSFLFKKKSSKISIWPSIFPTSCISVRKNFLKKFLNNVYEKSFPNLEVDARLVIFSKFYMNEYNVLYKSLTNYNYDEYGITSKISKFSRKWWLRRSEAFSYLKIIMKKKKKLFVSSLDYYFTILITSLIYKRF